MSTADRRIGIAGTLDESPPRIDWVLPPPTDWIVDKNGLSEVRIGFNEPVTLLPNSIFARTVRSGDVGNVAATYDSASKTGTITFSEAVRDDLLTLVVDFTVTDGAGNELDGEIGAPTHPVFPSGDGAPGGQAVVRFTILQGDANRDGAVDVADGALIREALGSCAGQAGYNALADLDGDGCVTVLDAAAYRSALGRSLPGTDGVAPTILGILEPAPQVYADFGTVWVQFSEIIPNDRFTIRSVYLLNEFHDIIFPAYISPSAFGDSALCVFDPPVTHCGTYEVRISNALSDVSGTLLTPPSSSPTITGTVPPPAPILNAHPTSTTKATMMVCGSAIGAESVEVIGPATAIVMPVIDGAFCADVSLADARINHVFFTGLSSCDGVRSAPRVASIIRDNQPPTMFIDFPEHGGTVTTATTDVAGRVGDLLSGFMGLTVTVNGLPASVNEGIGNNGTFFAPEVPLAPNQINTLQVLATDGLDNSTSRVIEVVHEPVSAGTPRMVMMGGNGQSSPVNSVLPDPIAVQLLQNDGTTPLVGKWVTFQVTRSNARLGADAESITIKEEQHDPGTVVYQAQTVADGIARAYWRLGGDAGEGNNRVSATATGVSGTAEFCATASAGPVKQINLGSGNNQTVEIGAPAA